MLCLQVRARYSADGKWYAATIVEGCDGGYVVAWADGDPSDLRKTNAEIEVMMPVAATQAENDGCLVSNQRICKDEGHDTERNQGLLSLEGDDSLSQVLSSDNVSQRRMPPCSASLEGHADSHGRLTAEQGTMLLSKKTGDVSIQDEAVKASATLPASSVVSEHFGSDPMEAECARLAGGGSESEQHLVSQQIRSELVIKAFGVEGSRSEPGLVPDRIADRGAACRIGKGEEGNTEGESMQAESHRKIGVVQLQDCSSEGAQGIEGTNQRRCGQDAHDKTGSPVNEQASDVSARVKERNAEGDRPGVDAVECSGWLPMAGECRAVDKTEKDGRDKMVQRAGEAEHGVNGSDKSGSNSEKERGKEEAETSSRVDTGRSVAVIAKSKEMGENMEGGKAGRALSKLEEDGVAAARGHGEQMLPAEWLEGAQEIKTEGAGTCEPCEACGNVEGGVVQCCDMCGAHIHLECYLAPNQQTAEVFQVKCRWANLWRCLVWLLAER